MALADGEKHGYAIGKEVALRTDGQVQLRAATLYTVIKRLLEDGLIDESAARPDPALDDERRRYYRLTRSRTKGCGSRGAAAREPRRGRRARSCASSACEQAESHGDCPIESSAP